MVMYVPIKNIMKMLLNFMKKQKNECGKYPYFVCDIKCVKYSNVESIGY